ncbi:MAG TPA: NfeD family protein [Anaerolineales bacterium]|nr:NfeD family protein [Anaerolineales bacterium]
MSLLDTPFLPNILYVLFVLGLWTLALALVTPGTGILEVLAVVGLGAAALGTAFVPINEWALIPLVLGVGFLVVSLLGRRTWLWLLLAAGSTSLGSAFLFGTEAGSPAVDPFLAVLTSALTVGFFWLAVGKALAAQKEKPRVEPLDVVGRTGVARTPIDPMGSAYVAGEMWTARSDTPIAVGSRIRVIERDGLILTVAAQDDPA